MTMLEITWSCALILSTKDEIHELSEVDDHNHKLKTIKYVNERVETHESKHCIIWQVPLKQNLLVARVNLYKIYSTM